MSIWTSTRVVLPVLALLSAPAEAQTLRVWGHDGGGQKSTAPDGSFRAIAGGSFQGLALRTDGTPVLWGSSPLAGAPPLPAEVESAHFRAVAIARDDAVLIRPDGTLVHVGRNPLLGEVPPGSYSAAAVAVVHAVAIAKDGTLEAWGSDVFPPPSGPLAGPPALGGLTDAPEGGPFKAVEGVVLGLLALREDGTLFGWGQPAFAFDAAGGWAPTPEDPGNFSIPGKTFTAIAGGNIHALALLPDGTVTGWGNALALAGGALRAPAHVRFEQVSAGWGFSVGLSTDGMLWGWGTPLVPFAPQPWTFAGEGWTRCDACADEHYYIPDERFKTVNTGAFHVMAITVGRAGDDDDGGGGD